MIAMTTNNSMRVKAIRRAGTEFWIFMVLGE
jgi:hypothetical protein